MKCLFTIDVEDWFHILDTPTAPDIDTWDSLPSIVEKNTYRLLELLDTYAIKANFFVLGWIAAKYPRLIRDIAGAGHDIASHGFAHRLVYEIDRNQFAADAVKAKHVIEDITGTPVNGYRASGFSVTKNTPWFSDTLTETGYTFDSSIFPAERAHGGMITAERKPHIIDSVHGPLREFPISVIDIIGRPTCLFGGGYFRLFPYQLIKSSAKKIIADKRPVIFYIHPREIDANHPRLPMKPYRRFKSYINVNSVIGKLQRLFGDFEFTTFSDYISERPDDR